MADTRPEFGAGESGDARSAGLAGTALIDKALYAALVLATGYGKTRTAAVFDEAREALAQIEAQLEGLESVRRCNDPMPTGDGMQLCDLWPDHDGPHATATGFEWKRR